MYSCSKNAAALVVGMLVDKNLLSYDTKVKEYWPKFGCLGKEDLTLADVMRHEAGLNDLGHTFVETDFLPARFFLCLIRSYSFLRASASVLQESILSKSFTLRLRDLHSWSNQSLTGNFRFELFFTNLNEQYYQGHHHSSIVSRKI